MTSISGPLRNSGTTAPSKLRLYVEQDDGRTDLVIDTKVRPGTDGDYAGNFRLETSDGVRVTGRAECSRP